MIKKHFPLSTDYVIVNNALFLHRNNRSFTNCIFYAKLYKTWEGADKRCKGKSWKFCQVSEIAS